MWPFGAAKYLADSFNTVEWNPVNKHMHTVRSLSIFTAQYTMKLVWYCSSSQYDFSCVSFSSITDCLFQSSSRQTSSHSVDWDDPRLLNLPVFHGVPEFSNVVTVATFPRWRTSSDAFYFSQQQLVCQNWRGGATAAADWATASWSATEPMVFVTHCKFKIKMTTFQQRSEDKSCKNR